MLVQVTRHIPQVGRHGSYSAISDICSWEKEEQLPLYTVVSRYAIRTSASCIAGNLLSLLYAAPLTAVEGAARTDLALAVRANLGLLYAAVVLVEEAAPELGVPVIAIGKADNWDRDCVGCKTDVLIERALRLRAYPGATAACLRCISDDCKHCIVCLSEYDVPSSCVSANAVDRCNAVASLSTLGVAPESGRGMPACSRIWLCLRLSCFARNRSHFCELVSNTTGFGRIGMSASASEGERSTESHVMGSASAAVGRSAPIGAPQSSAERAHRSRASISGPTTSDNRGNWRDAMLSSLSQRAREEGSLSPAYAVSLLTRALAGQHPRTEEAVSCVGPETLDKQKR